MSPQQRRFAAPSPPPPRGGTAGLASYTLAVACRLILYLPCESCLSVTGMVQAYYILCVGSYLHTAFE